MLNRSLPSILQPTPKVMIQLLFLIDELFYASFPLALLMLVVNFSLLAIKNPDFLNIYLRITH